MPRRAMIRPRRGTAAQWAVAEAGGPALAAGELAVVDGQVVTGDGITPVAALPRAGSQANAQLTGGRRCGFLGDSITNGSNAGPNRSYAHLTPYIVGTADVARVDDNLAWQSRRDGFPGSTSAQILGQAPAHIAQGIQAGCLLAGVNDASQGVPLSGFQASIKAIAALYRAAGIPLVVGTVPPRPPSGATTGTRTLTAAYNLWLRTWASANGVRLADVWGALVDPSTGDMAAAYDAGDGTHPNSAGHAQIALAFAAALKQVFPSQPSMVRAVTQAGYSPNPLMAGVIGATLPTGYTEVNGSGSARSYATVADASGALDAGQWLQVSINAAAETFCNIDIPLTGKTCTAGDHLLICGQVQIEDISGWAAATVAPPGVNRWNLGVVNGGSYLGGSAIPNGSNVPASPGRIATRIVATANGSGMSLRATVVMASGVNARVRFGALDIFNLTALGLA